MRVLRVVDGNDKGGVFTCEKQFIEELKARNVTVDVVIIGEGENYSAYVGMCNKAYLIPALNANYGGSTTRILYNIAKTYLYGLKYGNYLAGLFDNSVKYDAIIYQRPFFIHLAGILRRKTKSKCLWHLPNIARTSFSKNYYNYFCQKYGITQVANSYYTQSTLGGQCKHVVYPGYDGRRVERSTPIFRERLKLDAETPVYGIAARMNPDKAQDLVVDAFVNSKVPGTGGHLLVAGGPLDSEYAQKVREKAGPLLNKQVHFLGDINSMSAFYSSVDIVVNGRRNVEPFGITVAEAMGAGKPVIAYKLGGPSEMIMNGVNGWLVDSPTSQSYEETFNLSIDSKARWPEMGGSAKENSYKFTVEENATTLMQIIGNPKAEQVKKKAKAI